MNKSTIKAAAIALVFAPGAVNAEVLSQKRLASIFASSTPGPVDVETMHSRDKDLLVTLGITLRQKYGSLLTGSEVIFTRMERSGRIVYRMDFINVKNKDHAEGICQILEMEKCVILSENGDTSLISAEVDEDGLMSLDEYIPFSGPVRMERLLTKPSAIKTATSKTMRLPAKRPGNSEEEAEKISDPMEVSSVRIEVPSVSVKVAEKFASEGVAAQMMLPVSRPDVSKLRADLKMALPLERPEIKMALPLERPESIRNSKPRIAKMALPVDRPVSDFGLQDHLPGSRSSILRAAEIQRSEDFYQASIEYSDAYFISGESEADQLFQTNGNFSISMSGLDVGLEGFTMKTLGFLTMDLVGYGKVYFDSELPNVHINVEKPQIVLSAVIQATEAGIEVEFDDADSEVARSLPRTFVLNFSEDGVTAIVNPVVESASPEFNIASVVMTDAFSRPFDVTGDGTKDLQKLPKSRPDMEFYSSGIELVSETGSQVILEKLLAEPVRVAQVPGEYDKKTPGDKLLEKLSGKKTSPDFFQADLNDIKPPSQETFPNSVMDAVEEEEEEEEEKERSTPALPVVESRVVVEPEPKALVTQEFIAPELTDLPKAEDGLVDLDAIGSDNQFQALQVLGNIADNIEAEATRIPDLAQRPQIGVTGAKNSLVYQEQRESRPVVANESRGIFDVASGYEPDKVRSNRELRIELSYVNDRGKVAERAKELEAFIPDVIMDKGRFYGLKVSYTSSNYIIGIEAKDIKARDDIIWYLEKMEIPWTIRAAVDH
jgi:hypothetical protein